MNPNMTLGFLIFYPHLFTVSESNVVRSFTLLKIVVCLVTKTHRTPQTRSIQRRNIHKEITVFLFFLNTEQHKTRTTTGRNRHLE